MNELLPRKASFAPGEADGLLLVGIQHLVPARPRIEAADQLAQAGLFHRRFDILILVGGCRFRERQRLAQRAAGDVGDLRDEQHVV